MQIRYKGMFAAVEVPAAGLTFTRGETVTVSEDVARSLLDQTDNFEPVDAAAKALLKVIEKEREANDAPDQTIFDGVEAVGRAVA